MDDVSTFGVELFRLTYAEAVERNLLSDYRIIGWGIGESEEGELQQIVNRLNAAEVNPQAHKWNKALAMRALTLATFAAGAVPETAIKSIIAFCNRVKISKDLAEAVVSEPVQEWLKGYFKRMGIEREPVEFATQHVDATFPTSQRNDALHKLGSASTDNPFCISNVGIFGEGTDSPGLSAVAFINPRTSPIEVVQAVGRVMRKSRNKEFGYILVPVIIPRGQDPEIYLYQSDMKEGWKELGQILLALRAHDSRIEDDLASLFKFYHVEPKEDVDAEHLMVVGEPYKPVEVLMVNAKTTIVDRLIATTKNTKNLTVKQRLENNKRNKVRVVKDPAILNPSRPPNSVSAIRRNTDDCVYRSDMTSVGLKDNFNEWDPPAVVKLATDFIRVDKQRRQSQMLPVSAASRDRQSGIGDAVLKYGADEMMESGLHLRLLAQSGIQYGPKHDLNILRGTVVSVARLLRAEGLESVLAQGLGMANADRSSQGVADGCTVTAVIWLNAAIMHARLEKARNSPLKDVPSISSCVAHTTPIVNLMKAWTKVLSKDYVSVFGIALELLQDVAFNNLVGVSDALRLLAKRATAIADDYANIGMDHAGELFNQVMGNQRSDGAYFTQPLAAAMLTELALNAAGERDWLNEAAWDQLRTFDPSCGSGTILVAMLNAIKRRIRLAGGDNETLRRFHVKAVEKLMVGADINPVSLQLAGCQLTLGDVSVNYAKMSLYAMAYGVADPDVHKTDVKTGTLELLLDERIFPRSDELGDLHQDLLNLRLNMKEGLETTSLGDDLVETPPLFTLMNPPYTQLKDMGSKFSPEIQEALKVRCTAIWHDTKQYEPMLEGKKPSLAKPFELIGFKLAERNKGILGCVSAGTFLSAEDNRRKRQMFATYAHVDYVLTSHDPRHFNMSWDTNINECLIVLSDVSANQGNPTTFINLHEFPTTLEGAHEVIDNALKGKPFKGTCMTWDYERVKSGDWTPALFADATAAALTCQALEQSAHLRDDLIGGGANDGALDASISRSAVKLQVSLAGGDWRMTAAPMKRYLHFEQFREGAESVISGSGADAQKFLWGTSTKWLCLARLPKESDDQYSDRLLIDKKKMAGYRSHLLFTKGGNTSSGRLVAVASKHPSIGYSWMPVLGDRAISIECAKALSVWLNSTMGRASLRGVFARTIGFPLYNPIAYSGVKFPDIDTPNVLNPLTACFDETCSEIVPQFKEGRTPIRERWDDAVSVALGIDRELIATIADKLTCDPFVSKERFFDTQ